MCTVEKLLIKGVRSFSPDNQNVIEFYRPLTLIVGSNGAGKTTIIECLKQACTGELPPNTKSGQSFIHDPKVAGETEVKAQIKLRFRTKAGAPVVVCRSFSLSQKKAALQFKTLDSVMQTYNKTTGAKEAITYRCADMDRMVPHMMGVSKAILENVIFVHQEDSNWPLAEGKVLKAKFDDIFAATKYTKALDALRKLKSEKTAELKEKKAKLETLKAHKDQAHKLRSTVGRANGSIKEGEAQIQGLQARIETLVAEMRDLDAKLDRLTGINDTQTKLDAQITVLDKQLAEQKARLDGEEYEETTEELEAFLGNYEADLRERHTKVAEFARQASSKRLEAEALKEQYSKVCKRHGRLAAEAEAHASNVRARDELIRDMAARYGIPLHAGGPSLGGSGSAQAPPLPPSAVEAFCAELALRVAELQRQLHEAKAANRRQDEMLTADVDKANAALNRSVETRRMKKEQLQQLQRSADALLNQITSCAVDDAEIASLTGQKQAQQQEVAAKQHVFDQARFDDQIAANKRESDELGRRLADLRAERDRASAVTDVAANLRHRRADLAQKRNELDALLQSKRAKLLQLLGAAQLPHPSKIKAEAEEALSKQRGTLDAVKARLQQAEGRKRALLAELQAKTNEMGTTSVTCNRLLEDLRVGLAQATLLPSEKRKPEDFESSIKAMTDEMDSAKRAATTLESTAEWMRMQLAEAEKDRCCPLCSRGFEAASEFNNFLEYLRSEVDESHVRGLREKAQRAHEEMQALRALQPKAAQWAAQKAAIAPLQARMHELQVQKETLESEINDLNEEVAMAAADLAESTRLVGDLGWQAASLDKAVGELEKQVADLEARASAAAAGGRSVSEIDAELSEVERLRGHSEVDRDSIMRKQNQDRTALMRAQEALRVLAEQLAQKEAQAQRRVDLQRQLDDVTKQQSEAAAAIDSTTREVDPLTAARDAAVERRTAARAAAAQREAALDTQIREAVSARDQVDARCRPVDEYAAAGAGADLGRTTQELEGLTRRIEEAHKRVNELEQEAKQEQEGIAGNSETMRQIQAHLDCRRLKDKMDAMKAQRAQLEQQKAQIGNSDAVNVQYERLRQTRDDAKSQQDRVKGRLEVERSTMRAAEVDLSQPIYTNIDTKAKMMMVEVYSTKLAVEDLEKYHRALEKALLTFHTNKMADINRTIKELWQKTYRGQDIDYIQIKADADGARSYNYRVVMYSGGVELDMRGRCSAGQKVLASLLIRLALAETFCVACGILALDEPTTNLDAANSAALADALRTVMTSRRDQENFQLIIITHDETFASLIGTRQHAEYLWRVTKDEAQHSHVAQEDINE